MKNLYIFANGKYFGYFHTEGSAPDLRESIAINNGFDSHEITSWYSSEGLTLDEIQDQVDTSVEMM